MSLKGIFSYICLAVAMFAIVTTAAAQSAVYDAVPATLAPSYPSQPFQAQQTRQFGDYVHLAGTRRNLKTVTVTMVTWAPNSDWPLMPPGGWTHPFTINIYNAVPNAPLNQLGSLVATVTQTKTVPWRPAADPTCATPTQWRSPATGLCYNGYAFNLEFDMSSLNATLPNDLIIGIAYNTENWGYTPIGAPGPYNSLNVGTTPGPASVGTDDSTDRTFWDTLTAGWYTDGGAGGVGIFREDTNWTGYGTTPFRITAAFAPCEDISISNTITALTASTVNVPIDTTDVTGTETLSTDFWVTYNTAVLSSPVVTLGSVVPGGAVLTVNTSTPGTVKVSIFSSAPFTGAGTVANIAFTTIGLPGTSSAMNFSQFAYNEGDPCTTTTNGLVTIVGGTITGNVSYWNAARPVPSATLTGGGVPVVATSTDALGAYALSGFGPGGYTVTPSKSGGVLAGIITGYDSSLIAQHVVGNTLLTDPNQLVVADVSGAGGITSYDAALIARYAVALPDYGFTGSWRFVNPSTFYANVFANISGQNYTARLMGDVSGNWSASGPIGSRPAPPSDEQKPFRVNAPQLTASTGSEVTVPVAVRDTTGKGIYSYQFDLRYDPAVLEPAAAATDVAGTVSEGFFVTVNPVEPGLLKVVAFGAQPLTGGGRLINLKFNVVGGADSSSDLVWETFGINEGDVYFETGNGRVAVRAASNVAAINGRVLAADGQAVANARVTITDTGGQSRSVNSNGFGFFAFDGLQTGQTYTVTVTARSRTFAPRTVSVTGDAVSVDIIAEQ